MSITPITQIVSMLETGRAGEVQPMLEDLIQQAPGHVSARVLLARLLEANTDWEGALGQWQWAAYYCPDNPVIEKGLQKAVLKKLLGGVGSVGDGGVSGGSDVAAELETLVAASTPVAPPTSEGPVFEYQDLDRLIQDLESARIVPDPDIKMIPQQELETEIEDVVSETLARIYANQKFYEEASVVYEKLAVQKPDKAEEYLQKARDLRQKHVSRSSK